MSKKKTPRKDAPRGPGRPRLGVETRKRYQVVLEPRVAERLREYGEGNLSAGIARAADIATG